MNFFSLSKLPAIYIRTIASVSLCLSVTAFAAPVTRSLWRGMRRHRRCTRKIIDRCLNSSAGGGGASSEENGSYTTDAKRLFEKYATKHLSHTLSIHRAILPVYGAPDACQVYTEKGIQDVGTLILPKTGIRKEVNGPYRYTDFCRTADQ